MTDSVLYIIGNGFDLFHGIKILMVHFVSGCKHMTTIPIRPMKQFVIMMLCGQISKQGWPM